MHVVSLFPTFSLFTYCSVFPPSISCQIRLQKYPKMRASTLAVAAISLLTPTAYGCGSPVSADGPFYITVVPKDGTAPWPASVAVVSRGAVILSSTKDYLHTFSLNAYVISIPELISNLNHFVYTKYSVELQQRQSCSLRTIHIPPLSPLVMGCLSCLDLTP